MKKIIIFLFITIHTIACQRTPPKDPSDLQEWIEKIVSPEYRHLKVDLKKLDSRVQTLVAFNATKQLQKVVNGARYYSDEYKNPIFFDVVYSLLDLRADPKQVTDLFVGARTARQYGGLALAYQQFAMYMVEEHKCSLNTLSQATELHLQRSQFSNDDDICAMIIHKGITPRIQELTQQQRQTLMGAIQTRCSGIAAGENIHTLLLMAMTELNDKLKS